MYYDTIVRLNLKDIKNIDLEKTYDFYENNMHFVELYLLREFIPCPRCSSSNCYIKASKIQKIKYATPMESNIIINFHKRIFKCNSCNHYFGEPNPIIVENRSISLNADLEILHALKDPSLTFKKVASKYNVSTTYVSNLFDTKVDIKRGYMPFVLSIDEVYAKKLSKSHYCCVLYSPFNKELIDILPSRHKLNLIDYFSHIPRSERENIKYVSIDMWLSYRDISHLCFPNAKVCVDSFHVIKHLGECFDKIRIEVMKKYSNLKNEGSNYYWLFKNYNFFLRRDLSNLPDYITIKKSKMQLSKFQVIDYMLDLDYKLKLAYELKEEYRNFNSSANIDNAREWLYEIIQKFKSSKIPEFTKFWKLLEHWFEEIINSFTTINGRRISNGPIERINKDIKMLFSSSFGVSNFPRVRNRILYSLNSNKPILGNRKKYTNKRNRPPRGKYKK